MTTIATSTPKFPIGSFQAVSPKASIPLMRGTGGRVRTITAVIRSAPITITVIATARITTETRVTKR